MNQHIGRQAIDIYLAGQDAAELAEIARAESGRVNRTKSFLSLKFRELGWTMRRLVRNFLAAIGAPQKPPGPPPARRPLWSGPAPRPPSAARVLVEITETARYGYGAGIQRVTLALAEAVLALGEGLPVVVEDGRLKSYFRHAALPDEVELDAGDILLMPDAGWNYLAEITPIMAEAERRGAKTVTLVHDVIPMRYPRAFPPPLARGFAEWFERVLLQSHAAIAVSKSTARDAQALFAARRGPAPQIDWFRLGGDFRPLSAGPASRRVARISAEPFFLSVGTLEPRKGYAVALDAFERLWAAGVEARYVIVGRTGWKSRALRRRILTHPEHGRRLIWLADADDAELEALYCKARAVVAASFAEGFGLPLIEALQRGAAVVASDIPVFREVAGDAAIDFRLLDAADLARALRAVLGGATAPGQPPAALSWRQSARELFAAVRAEAPRAQQSALA